MSNNFFKAKDFMTEQQLLFAQHFEETIEAELELCARSMYTANKLACEKKITGASLTPEQEVAINLASSEIDYIRKYWTNRLDDLLELLKWRNPQRYEELVIKYLKKDRYES